VLLVLQRLKEKRSQNTCSTGWHLNCGVPGQLPFNRDCDWTERLLEFSVLRQECTECFINLCHCGAYSKSKAREKALGAAPSLLLLLSIVGGMTSYTARNVAISIIGLAKKVSIRSYSFFFFLSVVSLFRLLVPLRRWCFVFIIINTIVFLSGLHLFNHIKYFDQRGPLKPQCWSDCLTQIYHYVSQLAMW